MQHSHWFHLALAAGAFVVGCGAAGSGSPPPLDVGSEGSGGSGGGGPPGSGSALNLGDAASTTLAAHIEQSHVEVKLVTLNCAGDCADVVAVARGGYPPYTYAWEDGSTTPEHHFCPTSTTAYEVTVTDAGSSSGEIRRAPETVRVPLTANVLACPPDGGAPWGGPDAGSVSCDGSAPLLPPAGHYTGSLVCPSAMGSSGGAAESTGTLMLDLAADGTGSLFFQWSLAVIGAQATIHAPDCSQGQVGSKYDGLWGVPGFPDPSKPNVPPGLIPTGPIDGNLTFVSAPGAPSSISGLFNWYVPPVANAAASICHGTYSATLKP